MITKTSAEAQNQFGQLLDTVQREPVAITRHGRPAAFVISPREMGRDSGSPRKMAQENRGRLGRVAGNSEKEHDAGSCTMTDEDIVRMVHELR